MFRCVRAVGQRVNARADALLEQRVGFAASMTFLVLALGWLVGPLPQPFYATVAQVLPVFVLVAVVEGRYFTRLGGRDPLDRFFLRGMLALVLAGEAAALAALALTDDHLLLRGLVVNALGWSTLLVCLYAARGPARSGPALLGELADRVQSLSEAELASPTPRPRRWWRRRRPAS